MAAQRISCTMDAYHKMPGVSSSMLADFIDDPVHYYHRFVKRDWPRKDPTAAMKRGTLTHDVIESGAREMLANGLDKVCLTIPDEVLNHQGHCKGKAWTEWKEEHPARHYLKVGELNPFREILNHLVLHKTIAPLVESENKEVTITWKDEATGIECRCRIDVLEASLIADWKTTRDNRAHAFARDAEAMHYVRRLALYRRGVKALTGEQLPVMAIAIKNTPGFSVRPYELPEDWLREADNDLTRTLDRIANFDIHDALNAPIEVLAKPRFSSYSEQLESEVAA